MPNTKAQPKEERKAAKRAARKAAPAKAARTTPRGSNKQKLKSAKAATKR